MSTIRALVPAIRLQLPLFVFVMLLFMMGLVFGFMLVMALSVDQHQELSRYVSGFLQLALQGQISDIQLGYWQAYLAHLKWLLLIWLMGISVIGLPFVAVLDFLKGTLIGFTIGYLTTQLSWKGLLLAFGSVIPTNLFIVPALMVGSAASISFAFFLVRQRFGKGFTAMKRPILMYTLLLVILSLVLALATVLEVYAAPHFLKWFSQHLV